MRERSSWYHALCVGLIAAFLGIACMSGCVSGILSSKPSSGSDSGQGKGIAGKSSSESDKKGELKKPRIPPPPGSEPVPPTGSGPGKTADPRKREEINSSAFKFAENIEGVLHIKTCFSKMFKQWYLLLYLKKGDKITMEQYVWNEVTKEWEIYYEIKELDKDKLEFHVKSEVLDEECSVLK